MLTEIELQDWIVGEVRKYLPCRGFSTELTFVRRTHGSGAGWDIGTATGSSEWSIACRTAFEAAVRHAQRDIDLIGWPASVSRGHQNLAMAVGAAKDQAKSLLKRFEHHTILTDRCSAVYLALALMHRQLLTVDPSPPPLTHFAPELEQLLRRCTEKLSPLQPLVEAALRVAREVESEP
jgi:hypothetical protein